MKTLKFFLLTALFAGVVGVSQSNAQALVEDYPGYLVVEYTAWDGTPVVVGIYGDVHGVQTPSGNWKYEFHGMLPEGIPPPKTAVKYFNGTYWVLITPEGDVNSWYTLKKPKD